MISKEHLTCELVIIGAGMAGMATALFAANRNISTIQLGNTAGMSFASGLLDLLSVYPTSETKTQSNPWKAIENLKKSSPIHPYALQPKQNIQKAFSEILAFFNQSGLPYITNAESNTKLITSMGTLKSTYAVPKTMRHGITALQKKSPCLLVDFFGMKEFSADQIKETLKKDWSNLRTIRIEFPGMGKEREVYPEHMARSLQAPDNRKALADLIRQHIKNEKYIGLPAILGIYHTTDIMDELEELIGCPLFEIPTPPVSVPGIRIKETFERQLPQKEIQQIQNSSVNGYQVEKNGNFTLSVIRGDQLFNISTKGIILASGRFIGGGLTTDRFGVKESIFNLPVSQPDTRNEWYNTKFFDKKGHPINSAGLEIDNTFRPINKQGLVLYKNLFAAGTILAHQDWKREKSGSGIAISTAYNAIHSFIDFLVEHKNPVKTSKYENILSLPTAMDSNKRA